MRIEDRSGSRGITLRNHPALHNHILWARPSFSLRLLPNAIAVLVHCLRNYHLLSKHELLFSSRLLGRCTDDGTEPPSMVMKRRLGISFPRPFACRSETRYLVSVTR